MNIANIKRYAMRNIKLKPMAQQTAVEWLNNKILNANNLEYLIGNIDNWIQQAKQMEKEQIIENNKLKAIVEFYEQGCGKEGCKAKEPHVH